MSPASLGPSSSLGRQSSEARGPRSPGPERRPTVVRPTVRASPLASASLRAPARSALAATGPAQVQATRSARARCASSSAPVLFAPRRQPSPASYSNGSARPPRCARCARSLAPRRAARWHRLVVRGGARSSARSEPARKPLRVPAWTRRSCPAPTPLLPPRFHAGETAACALHLPDGSRWRGARFFPAV